LYNCITVINLYFRYLKLKLLQQNNSRSLSNRGCVNFCKKWTQIVKKMLSEEKECNICHIPKRSNSGQITKYQQSKKRIKGWKIWDLINRAWVQSIWPRVFAFFIFHYKNSDVEFIHLHILAIFYQIIKYKF
jgi:hypothetical protein